MKKSIKWLLCALTVVSMAFAATGCEEEHTHEYAAAWSYNESGHWHAATCEHSDQKANLSTHTDENNDGVCEVCNYGSDHVHTYANVLSYDENNHWYAVTCGHTAEGKDVTAHVDENNDKVCDGCGYDYDHTHTYSSGWNCDETNHWHDATCGCSIAGSDTEAHIDRNEDGVCEVCLGKTYAEDHEHTYGSEYKYDVTSHWQVSECHPGVTSAPAAHGDVNNDGVCDTCGFDYLHEHTYSEKWTSDTEYHWHAVTCGHNVEVSGKEAHTDENCDGVCDVCEGLTYDKSEHSHTYSDEFKSSAEGHWHNADCEHSGATSVVEAHTGMNPDGVCDTCGWYDETHTHSYSSTYSYDENNHWKQATCGHSALTSETAAHEDNDNDGACDTCGYDGGHIHTYASDWSTDEHKHWHDATCGCSLTVVDEDHVDENNDGACDVCGYDGDHVHTYAEVYSYDADGHWYAVTCGHDVEIQGHEAHSDYDGDGVCEVCGGKNYDETHEHEYGYEYYADVTGHWHNAICEHYALSSPVEAHIDENNDGVCDICLYATNPAHEHNLVYVSADAESHTYACADHSGYTVVEAHEGMGDGYCDVCGYCDIEEGHVHTYNEYYTYDYTCHYYEATCSHTDLVEYEAHVDDDCDGYCDVCGGETFDNVVATVASEEAHNNIISGTYYDASGSIIYYELGQDYCHKVDVTWGWEYWYAVIDGKLFAIQDQGNGYNKPYGATEDNAKGPEFSLAWALAGGYGVEDTITNMWEEAKLYGGYAYGEGNEYAFNYQYNYYDYYIYDVTVYFTTAEYAGCEYVSSATFYMATYYFSYDMEEYDAFGNIRYNVENATMSNDYTIFVESQRAGNQTATCPFNPNDYYASEYDYEDGEGNKYNDGDDITLEMGSSINLYMENILPETASFDFDSFTYSVDGVEDDSSNVVVYNNLSWGGYLQMTTSWAATPGVYEVVLSTNLVSYTFTVEIAPASLQYFNAAAYIYNAEYDYYQLTVTDNVPVYVGETLKVKASVNSYADDAHTAEVTYADGTYEIGEGYQGTTLCTAFTANEVGTYEITLTSTADPSFSAVITVTVVEAPSITDTMKGTMIYDASDWWSTNSITVEFVPAEEGADYGVAYISINAMGEVTDYTVNYAYDGAETVELTNEDGSEFDQAWITWESFTLKVEFIGLSEDWWTGGYVENYYSGVLVEYVEKSPLLGEYRCTDPETWKHRWQIVLNEDGTGYICEQTYNSDSWYWYDDSYTEFDWTEADNGDGTYTVEIFVTWSDGIEDGSYTVVTDDWGCLVIENVMVNTVAGETVPMNFEFYE